MMFAPGILQTCDHASGVPQAEIESESCVDQVAVERDKFLVRDCPGNWDGDDSVSIESGHLAEQTLSGKVNGHRPKPAAKQPVERGRGPAPLQVAQYDHPCFDAAACGDFQGEDFSNASEALLGANRLPLLENGFPWLTLRCHGASALSGYDQAEFGLMQAALDLLRDHLEIVRNFRDQD